MLNLCRNSLFLCLGSYAILSRIIDAMQMLFCENLNSTKLRMKHMGGKWLYGLCWVASLVHVYGSWSTCTCGWPPRNRGIWRTPSDDCFQCSHCHMGSGLINYVAWTLSGLTSRCRGLLGGTGQARVGGKMLLKDLVSFFSFPYHYKCVKDSLGWMGTMVNVHNLCRV